MSEKAAINLQMSFKMWCFGRKVIYSTTVGLLYNIDKAGEEGNSHKHMVTMRKNEMKTNRKQNWRIVATQSMVYTMLHYRLYWEGKQ